MGSSFDDVYEVNCSGTITYTTSGGETKTAYVLMPCGAQHDTVASKERGFVNLQIPYKYQIYAERARLAPCCYWREEDLGPEALDPILPNKEEDPLDPALYRFTNVLAVSGTLPKIKVVDKDTKIEEEIEDPDLQVVGGWAHEPEPSFYISSRTFFPILTSGNTSIPTRCKKQGATLWNQGQDGSPPCNGAKTLCPFYTGPTFDYITDEQMAPGQPVIGQMVQELRSLILEWQDLKNGQQRWENSFDLPYIWGRDFDDLPTAKASEDYTPGPIEDIPVFTILTKIYWNVKTQEVTLTKVPGELSGTDQTNSSDRLSPPGFPTIVNELGNSLIPSIKITFPKVKEEDIFEYTSFNKDANFIYLAGLCSTANTIFAVNSTLLTDCPKIETLDLINNKDHIKEVDDFLLKYVVKSYSLKVSGFNFTASDSTRFWNFRPGVELLTKKTNVIFVLSKLDSKWSFQKVQVRYTFVHCEIVQRGHEGFVPLPDTRTLGTRLANLNTKENIFFDLHNIDAGQPLTISKVYHYYILDRSASRFLREKNPPPNRRFWKVVKAIEDRRVVGTGTPNSGGLFWSKFDNCNRYLVEIYSPGLSSALPAGIDRSWEPKKIEFSVAQESGESLKIDMEVIEDFGRSYNGDYLPVRFIIVEPKTSSIDFKTPKKSSLMSVVLDTFEARSIEEEGEDQLNKLLEDFRDESLIEFVGGASITKPSEEDVLSSSDQHSLVKEDSSFSVGRVNKFDMSYMVELSYRQGSDQFASVIGRKWVYGVGDLYDSWCRDIDIKYMWSDTQQFRQLLPDYFRKRTDLIDGSSYPSNSLENFSDIAGLKAERQAIYHPKCGDHEVTFGKPGPMFSPYEDCDQPETIINDLSIRINYKARLGSGLPPRLAEKYRAPDLYHPLVYKHNILFYLEFPCIFEFSLGHFIRSGLAKFVGFSRIRGPISKEFNPLKYLLYESNGWQYPKFGNIGRDMVRIFRTMHFREYLYLGGSQPAVLTGWMPSFPFVPSNSIFENNSPRSMLDQYCEKIVNYPLLDHSDFADFDVIHSYFSKEMEPRSTPREGTGGEEESFHYERKSFDDVYKVRKIRNKDGEGVRFPDQGYYFNLKSKDVVWAIPEQYVDVLRDLTKYKDDYINSLEFIGGIKLFKPRNLQGTTLPINDRFKRPVSTGLDESKYTLKLKDVQYTSTGAIRKYAQVYLHPNYPLYFDRFTGEIKDTDAPDSQEITGIKQLYAITDKEDLVEFLGEQGRELKLAPVFEFITQVEEDSAPKTLPEEELKLAEFQNLGNLFHPPFEKEGDMYIYANASEEGPLVEQDLEWVGFIPSIKVSDIKPRYMPKSEVRFDSDDDTLLTEINFSSYPNKDWQVRDPKSSIYLKNSVEQFVDGSASINPSTLNWLPLDTLDMKLGTSEAFKAKGQILPFIIEVRFNRPIELSSINIEYKVYGLLDTDSSNSPAGIPTPFDIDPSFKITAHDILSLGEVTLLDKPEFIYKKNALTELTRKFPLDKLQIVTDRIRIAVGRRTPRVGFNLSNLAIKQLNLSEAVSETIAVLDTKYFITTGLFIEGDPKHRAAQDPQRLAGTIPAPDISDNMEYQGIVEMWRPLDLEEEEVKTKGKLKRIWANKFLTSDTLTFLDEESAGPNDDVIFFDNSVDEAEERQGELLEKLQDQFDIHPELEKIVYKYLIPPQDRAFINKIGNSIAPGNITFRGSMFDLADAVIVAKPPVPQGWQDKGFRACVDTKTKSAGCFGTREPSNVGGRGPHKITASEHTVCNQRLFEAGGFDASRMGTFDLFEIAGNLQDGVQSTSPVGSVLQEDFRTYEGLLNEATKDRAGQSELDRYRERLAKKKINYLP